MTNIVGVEIIVAFVCSFISAYWMSKRGESPLIVICTGTAVGAACGFIVAYAFG